MHIRALHCLQKTQRNQALAALEGTAFPAGAAGQMRVKGIFRRFHYLLQARLQMTAFGRIVNPRALSPSATLPSRPGGVFKNPDPILEKESLYELDDQRSPS
jgi:hypothetical protein